MMYEFKPGDVVLIPGRERERRAIVDGEGNCVHGVGAYDHAKPGSHNARRARPLVVLDPENDEDVRRLADAYCDQLTSPKRSAIHDRIRAALRSLVAQPTCSASLTIAGKPYACAEQPEHDGPHRNPDADAVWS